MNTQRPLALALVAFIGSLALGQDSPSAGYDKKFFLADASRDNRLNIGGQIQFRYKATFQDDDPGFIGADNDTTIGFSMRRMKLKLDGNVISDKLSYKVVGAFSRGSGTFNLEDAYMAYEIDSAWELRAGQFKAPFMREELVSSSVQQFVERSIVNETFNQDFSQGVQIAYSSERVRAAALISDGFASRNTPYNLAGEADFALTARADILLGETGDWKRFKDFTSWRGSETNAMLGAAVHWQTMGETNPAGPDVDVLTATADASVEGDGWSLFASFVWRRTDTAGAMTFDDLGASVQGGVFVTDQTELIARWDSVFADSDRALPGDTLGSITAGFNYFFFPESHAAKLSGTISYALDPISDLAGVVSASDSLAIRPDRNSGQIGLMLQMQLLF